MNLNALLAGFGQQKPNSNVVGPIASALWQMTNPVAQPLTSVPAAAPSLSQADIDQVVLGLPQVGATELPPMNQNSNSSELPSDIGAAEFHGLLDDHLADYKSPYLGLKGYARRFADLAADQSSTKRAEASVVAAGQSGLTVEQQDELAKKMASARSSSALALKTTHLDDSQFDSLINQLRARLGQAPPAPDLSHGASAPNLQQVLLAAVAALADRRNAAQYLATPFASQTAEHERQQQLALQNYQLQRQSQQQDVSTLSDLLRLQNQRDVTQSQLDEGEADRQARIYGIDQTTQRGLLDDLHTSTRDPLQLKAAFEALDAAGFGSAISPETRAQLLQDAAGQKESDDKEKWRPKVYAQVNDLLKLSQEDGKRKASDRLAAFDSAINTLKQFDPADPHIGALQAQRDGVAQDSERTNLENAKRKADLAQYGLKVKEAEGRIQSYADKHALDTKKLAVFDTDHKMQAAKAALELRDIQSRIAARSLSGQLALSKAKGGDGGGLSKSDVKLLGTESSALSKEASVLRSQRGALVDRFTGEVRRGEEGRAKEIDARLESIRQRQSEIGATYRINREADERRRASAAKAMPPPLKGNVQAAARQIPSGWSFGSKP